METAIRWSPSSDLESQRFLHAEVLKRSFSLGTIESYRPLSTGLVYKTSPRFRDVPTFRAFDWAPFEDKLVAVGTPNGDTTLLNLDDVSLTVSYAPKSSRPCNAIAFSAKGLVASGLERSRNDASLNVWDANAPALAVEKGSHGQVEPLRQLAFGDSVRSIKVFNSQPDVMVVGIKGVGIRCYDTRDSASNASMQFSTHCVHNVAIDPLHEVHFASAGPGRDTTIHVWDVRMGPSQAASTFSAPKGSSFGSMGEGPSSGSTRPLLAYDNVFNSEDYGGEGFREAHIWSLRYCRGKSGLLGSLASTGDFRIFETQELHGDSGQEMDGRHLSLHESKDNAEPLFTRRVQRLAAPSIDSKDAHSQTSRIVSFDFTNLAGSRSRPAILVLRSNHSIGILEAGVRSDVIDVSISGELARDRNGLLIAGREFVDESNVPHELHDLPDIHSLSLNPKDFAARRAAWMELFTKGAKIAIEGFTDASSAHISSFERHKRLFGFSEESALLSMDEALTLSTMYKQLCQNGYGLDCNRNAELMTGNRWLQAMWTWVARMRSFATEGTLRIGPLDLSYLGIYRLWNQDLGTESTARRSSKTKSSLADVIRRLANDHHLPNHITAKTNYIEHRQLCLLTIGFALKEQDLAGEIKKLAREGQQSKAAALSMMLGHHTLAANALKAGKVEPHHRALALAIAGYSKGTTDDSWNDVVQEVLQDITDPYSRAIFALVKRGDWTDVLKQISLPLRERVGIALLHLSDAELARFLDDATATAIREGDVEGIVLTGLTEQAVSLFETYIRIFSDLQTPVLALAHTCPKFFNNIKFEDWKARYRSWLDSWRLYAQRSKFDIESTRLSINGTGESTLPASSRQQSLACNFCEKALHTIAPDSSAPVREDSANSSLASGKASVLSDVKFGTVCPKCGAHMPRCVVCAHWLGMPDRDTKYGSRVIAEKSKANNIDNMVTVCQKCLHMTHVGHAELWFARHSICPQIECECRCQEGIASPT